VSGVLGDLDVECFLFGRDNLLTIGDGYHFNQWNKQQFWSESESAPAN
jgi:hypothetical protein